MHLLQRSLFRDVFATCGVAIDGFNYGTRRCFIRNDGVRIVTAKLIIELWELRGRTHSIFSKEFTLNPNGDTGESNRTICYAFIKEVAVYY